MRERARAHARERAREKESEREREQERVGGVGGERARNETLNPKSEIRNPEAKSDILNPNPKP